MTGSSTVTREQAEAVLALVEKTFAAYIDPGRAVPPRLVEDYDGYQYAIVWEENSPYQWANLFLEGGVDAELSALLAYVGASEAARVEPAKLPAGVGCGALMSFVLSIYPDSEA